MSGSSGIVDMNGFELGTPALICRWRLSKRRLPLENRHMRGLLARTVNGQQVTPELVAWAKQHIEWTLDAGAIEHPDGTLMLIVDTEGRAAMTVGPYEPLADDSLIGLARRAERATREARTTGVAPETLWLVKDNVLVWSPGESCAASGAASLIDQLAHTLGISVRTKEGIAESVLAGTAVYDEAFLASDEHGIVVARDAAGNHGKRMAMGYQRLLERIDS